jgi:uncharacterized protein YcbX
MQGQALQCVDVDALGVAGDRSWGVRDLDTGRILTGRREPALLLAEGRLRPDGTAEVVLPDGTVTDDDSRLSTWLGRPVSLVEAGPGDHGRYENPVDAEAEDGAWLEWEGPVGSFRDSTRTQVSILGDARLGDWDPRRFRANVLLDADERALLGRTVSIGGATLQVVKGVGRCVMVTRPQPGGIGHDLSVLRTINAWGGKLAVGAMVVEPGAVSVGDEVTPQR